jgi:hypothetical protein
LGGMRRVWETRALGGIRGCHQGVRAKKTVDRQARRSHVYKKKRKGGPAPTKKGKKMKAYTRKAKSR